MLLRLIVNVIKDVYQDLAWVAQRRDITETSALDEAMIIYAFIHRELAKGNHFLVFDGHTTTEVFFDRIGQAAPLSQAATITEFVKGHTHV